MIFHQKEHATKLPALIGALSFIAAVAMGAYRLYLANAYPPAGKPTESVYLVADSWTWWTLLTAYLSNPFILVPMPFILPLAWIIIRNPAMRHATRFGVLLLTAAILCSVLASASYQHPGLQLIL